MDHVGSWWELCGVCVCMWHVRCAVYVCGMYEHVVCLMSGMCDVLHGMCLI